jgi:hypothetical protein
MYHSYANFFWWGGRKSFKNRDIDPDYLVRAFVVVVIVVALRRHRDVVGADGNDADRKFRTDTVSKAPEKNETKSRFFISALWEKCDPRGELGPKE